MHIFFIILLSVCFVGLQSAYCAPLYEVFEKNGIVTFTTRKPAAGMKYRRVRSKSPKFSKVHKAKGSPKSWSFRPRSTEHDRIIKQKSRAYGVHPALTKAVIHVESAFRVKAKSPVGAAGLMQLMPQTAKRFGVSDVYSAPENINGGVRYLRWLIDHFDGKLDFVLAGYNAGEGAVKKYQGIPPYRETKEYVRRVKIAFRGYKKAGFL